MSEKNDALPIDQHPGVQGLAQLGRNAIDRVIELEQARARDNVAFKQLLAQRDALLKALKRMATIIDKMGDMPDGFIHPSPWQELKCEEALTQALAAIKAVEEGK